MEKVSVAEKEIMQSTSSLSSMASQLHAAFPEEEMTCLWAIPLVGPTPRNTDLSFTPDWPTEGSLLWVTE